MNNLFKMSVLATLVAFSVVACSSGGHHSIDNIKPADPKPADPKPADPTVDKYKPTVLDSSGKKWRIVRPNSSKSFFSNGGRTTTLNSNSANIVITTFGNWNYGLSKFNSYDINLDEKIEGQGLHTGILVDDELDIKKLGGNYTNEINYVVVNNPYSSYGVLFTDAYDIDFFGVAQSTDRGNNSQYTNYKIDELTGKLVWTNEFITGDATYKGDVIATRILNDETRIIPKVDGKVTLNIHFGDNPDIEGGSKLSGGYIDSDSIGKITFDANDIAFIGNLNDFIVTTVKAKGFSETGFASVQLNGKNLHDMFGTISLDRDQSDRLNNTDTVEYRAIFGGTRQ